MRNAFFFLSFIAFSMSVVNAILGNITIAVWWVITAGFLECVARNFKESNVD